MHFLVKAPTNNYTRCIKESFSGTWEHVIKIGIESSLIIDTFVTNQKKLCNTVCNVTVEELNSLDQVINTFFQTYKVADTMENWKWEKHIFDLNNFQENKNNKTQ